MLFKQSQIATFTHITVPGIFLFEIQSSTWKQQKGSSGQYAINISYTICLAQYNSFLYTSYPFPQIKYCFWLYHLFLLFNYFSASTHSLKIFIHLIHQVQFSTELFYYFLGGRTDILEHFVVNLAEFYL